jgi:2-polyprenyl-3-methyl-5-hydroxy-6-metoxy-1,4-benzoquinol methylase
LERGGGAPLRLVRCESCDLVFEDPRPSPEAIDAFYDDANLWRDSRDADGNRRSYVNELEAKKPVFKDLVRRIERFKSNGRVLDVGSGPGLLEVAMDRDRWHVEGVEMSPYIAEFGPRELGTRVHAGLFEEMELEPRSFDVVVMKYVLDHMEDPFGALLRAREAIRDDGLLVVADLINIDSFCARYFGEGHRLLHPMHFTYFSPDTIRSHLERVGFGVAKIDYPFLRTPYFSATAVRGFAARVARRAFVRARRTDEVVVSPAWRGNMMDVFAVPR